MESRDGYNAASFPPLPYSRYLRNTVAAPSPLAVAHSQVSYPRTSFPSLFCSTRFPFFVLLAAETVYSECAAEDFPGRGNMRTPHGPYMSEAEPEPGLPARARARARARPTAPAPARPLARPRRLPAACLPSHHERLCLALPMEPAWSVLHAMCLLAAVAPELPSSRTATVFGSNAGLGLGGSREHSGRRGTG
jgi:hypothetical protein